MFTEVIKLVPALDKSALNSMFQSLSTRFTSVAKKFGEGMKNALKFGGIIALVSGLVAKLLNPLEKAEAIIDKLLNKGDDAQTYAEEFNSTPGKVLRLQALGQAHGLDAEQLRNLVSKFQGALSKEQEAQLAPGRIEKKLSEATPEERPQLLASLKAAREEAAKGGTLHEFLNEKDAIEGFFKFIQSLQAVGKVDKSQQTVIESQVFGERVRGKAAEFLNATDFAEILAKLPTAAAFDTAAKKTGDLSDKKDLLTAIREGFDFITKSTLVNESQVNGLNVSAGLADQADNETLKRFDATLSTSIAIQKLEAKFDQFATDMVNKFAPALIEGINEVTTIMPQVLTGVKTIAGVASEFLPSWKQLKGAVQAGFDGLLEFAAKASVGTSDFVSELFSPTPPGQKTAPFDPVRSLFTSKPSQTDDAFWKQTEKGNQEFRDGIESLSKTISDFNKAAYQIWDEFKSSRIYRTFGGGGDK